MMLNSVDLPQPDGPITPRNSPGATVSETLSTAVSDAVRRLEPLDDVVDDQDRLLPGSHAPARLRARTASLRQTCSLPRVVARCSASTIAGERHGSQTGGMPDRGAWSCVSFPSNGRPGAPAPVLPGAVERVGAGARDDLVDLAGGQELDVAHRHRLHLQLGIHLQIDRVKTA